MTGSSARFSSSTSSPAAERSSSFARIAAASACVSPIAAKTTLNGSPAATAWAASWPARSRCGSPATEKIGSFWPRTRVISSSITEMPVSTGSAGGRRNAGLIGNPVTGAVCSPVTGGPPSRGSPRPLQTRPSQRGPTGIRSGLPANSTVVPAGSMPAVPSSTCTTARSPSASSTRPCRGCPPPSSRMVANSSQPTPLTPRTISSGPRSSPIEVNSGLAHPVTARSRARAAGRARASASSVASIVAAWLATCPGVAASSLARSTGEKSCSSIRAASAPRAATSWHFAATASTASASAAARAPSQ